jgi:hypothetical protein
MQLWGSRENVLLRGVNDRVDHAVVGILAAGPEKGCERAVPTQRPATSTEDDCESWDLTHQDPHNCMIDFW